MNRKTLVLPAVVGLLAPVLVACGGTDGGSGGGDAIVVGTTDKFVATEETKAPLDPAYTYDTASWNVLRQTLQTLMRTPASGGTPVPEAAESCGFTDKVSESYRCKLRSGLKFSDGTPITAEDVKFSVQRVLDIHDDNGVSGLLTNIDKMEANGDEVVFHLATPDATFPYKLTTPAAAIVSKKNYEGNKLRSGFQVDGSGPYTMKPEVKDGRVSKIVFTKNDAYKGDLKLRNDRVELRTFPDAESMGEALDSGDIDIMSRAMSPEQIRNLTEAPKEGIRLTEMPGLEIRYLGFNTNDPSVKDKAVRQAMAAVVDRGRIAGQVYGSTAEPLYSLIPTSIAAHTNSFFNKYGDPNRKKAAVLLANANITTPVKLKLHYTTDHYGPGTAKEFANLKAQLNQSKLFDVSIEGTEWSKFSPAQKRGEYAVYGLGWFPDFPDPDNYIAPFLDKDNFLNTPYVNADIRRLIPESRRAADRTSASDAFTQIQNIIAADVPVLPLWQGKQYIASRNDVSGVERMLNSSSELMLWEVSRGTA
ncbi:ABC transporter substrate-binding protein [Streptomyces sp. NBC_00829]|uniref:ABC transporter substrate-binding protein n=1 Tax=Streptomyces sp. NBC_00829 TaxID=2903679 RepID=UPI003869364B|nr:ABC transporter substrate-binding protein [Streptomyces sp. NBC_00829]